MSSGNAGESVPNWPKKSLTDVYSYGNIRHVSSTDNPPRSSLRDANSFTPILLQTLCRSRKRQVLCNQANPNSLRKTPGMGVSAAPTVDSAVPSAIDFQVLCSHDVTNPFFQNSFVFTSIQIPGGVGMNSRPPRDSGLRGKSIPMIRRRIIATQNVDAPCARRAVYDPQNVCDRHGVVLGFALQQAARAAQVLGRSRPFAPVSASNAPP